MLKARDVAVVGVYTTKQERVSSKTSLELQIEALWGALDDAGMTMKDVDAWYDRSVQEPCWLPGIQ